MSLIAFDFDGVILDSSREKALIGLLGYREISPETRLYSGNELCMESCNAAFNLHPAEFDSFIRLLQFSGNIAGWDIVNYALIDRAPHTTFLSLEEYLDAKQQFLPLSNDELKQSYRRQRLKIIHHPRYRELCPLFPGIKEQLRALQESATLVICTTKARDMVDRIVGFHGLDCFDRIYSGEDKHAMLREACDTYNTPMNELVFIEDFADNLKPFLPLGVRTLFARYGQGGAIQHAISEQLGIPTIDSPTDLADAILLQLRSGIAVVR